MIPTLTPYPDYKYSGVPWLGEVPKHWEVKPLKRWVSINAAVLPDTTAADYQFRYIDIGTVGTGFLIREPQQMRFGDAPSRARRILRRGDTIVSTVRTYLKAVYHVDRDVDALVCSTGFAVLTPGPGTQPRYVSYLAQSSPFTDCISAESVGTAYPAIAESRLGSFHVPVPTSWEQTAIVRFLDYMDRRIRRYIRAKQKLIKLLEEYKQALIHQAVTGKIDVRTGQPYPAYKPSGVEWLGDVPAHWEILPLKSLAKCYRNGATPPTTKDFYYIRGTIPWYGPSSFDSGEIVSTPVRFISNTAIEDGVARLIHGPALLVVVIGATAGRMTLMEQDGTTNQQITAFELPYDWKTCLFLLRQLRFSESWLRETASTATIPILNTNIVTHLPCLMPPPKERCAIVEYLDAQTAKIDNAISAARREIDLLREYRTRLIADVVTGKVDVREVAAQLPEEPPEEAELMDADEIAEGEATDDDAAAEALSEEEVEP